MGTIKILNKWANRHTYYPLDFLRVALGVFLFMKGVYFIGSAQILIDVIQPLQEMSGSGMMLIHYVVPAHLIGGILIAFGLLTRWAVFAQLPIILGAVLVNFIGPMNTENMLSASFVLLFCVFFLIYGSGKHSVDYYFKMEK
ncbi:MAG: DoxX family protein [Cellulophaga sp.]